MSPTALDPAAVYCSSVDGLEHQWPDVAGAFDSLCVAQQKLVAVRAAAIALEAVDQPAPNGDEQAMTAEVERLDVIAWDIQDDEAAAPDAYGIAFRRARAANAYALARFGGRPADAVYEALHALGAPADAGSVLGL